MSKSQITILPLGEKDRAEFIELANGAFERILERMEPMCPESTRKLWDAGKYIDNLLHGEMLPIDREYAQSLIGPFLVGHVATLAGTADKKLGVTQVIPSIDFDEADFESEVQPALTCDVEINIEIGKTHQEVLKSTAEALRRVAAQIEANELDTGFHPINLPSGEKIGQVYLDHYEIL